MSSCVDPAVSLLARPLAEPGPQPGEPCHVPWPQGHSTNWAWFGLIAWAVWDAKRGCDRMIFLQNFKHLAGGAKCLWPNCITFPAVTV